MKKIILGYIIGLLTSLSITAFAAVEYNILPNPFPVIANGEQVNVDGLNINNSTYLKVRDFEQLGLGIDFQNNTIYITTQQSKSIKNEPIIEETNETTTIQEGNTNMQIPNVSNPKSISYKGYEAIDKDGIIYVRPPAATYLFEVSVEAEGDNIILSKNDKSITFNKYDTNYCLLISNVALYIKLSVIEEIAN